MIDLRTKELPSRLVWEGGSAAIYTDFRVWIEFGEWLRKRKLYLGIFEGLRAPQGDDWQLPAIRFYQSPNVVPRATRAASNAKLLDMVVDGEFIVASFQQAYGIDLTSCDMHWHRFKALLEGLPDDTKLSKILGYRSYMEQDSKRKQQDIMREQRARWSLPRDEEEEDDGMGGFGAFLNAFGR